MTWVRLDEEFPDHPKVAQAGPLASWLHVCALAYCNRYLTDGFVPAGQVPKLADFSEFRVKSVDLAKRLVDVTLWEPAEGGYRIHDFTDYQPTRAAVEAERKTKHETKSRAGRLGAAARWGGKEKPRPMAEPMAPGMAEPMAGDMAQRCQKGSHSDGPVPVPLEPSLSLLSDSRPPSTNGAPPDGGGEGNPQSRPPADPFVARIVAALGGHRRHLAKASALVERWRTVLDTRFIDQAIGLCEQAEERPRSVAYFEAALRETAAQHGVEPPAMPAGSVAS